MAEEHPAAEEHPMAEKHSAADCTGPAAIMAQCSQGLRQQINHTLKDKNGHEVVLRLKTKLGMAAHAG